MPEVTRRAYMPRMSRLARVIRWSGWARLNFCWAGHFVWNDHHIEKFEKFDHSRDFPIIFPYTYDYAGAACLSYRGWGPFFESKKYIALTDIWMCKMTRRALSRRVIFLASESLRSTWRKKIDNFSIKIFDILIFLNIQSIWNTVSILNNIIWIRILLSRAPVYWYFDIHLLILGSKLIFWWYYR